MLFALFGLLLATVGATDYVYQGFTPANLACGTDSGALNVGLSKPTGVSKFKINQIAFAIYGTRSLPANIEIQANPSTSRLSTSSAQLCCAPNCDLATAVGGSWYNGNCGVNSCGGSSTQNTWYYMDFSAEAVGTTDQTGISQILFYDGGGNQIAANMINIASGGSAFFYSYDAALTTSTASATSIPTATTTPQPTVCAEMEPSGIVDEDNLPILTAGWRVTNLIAVPRQAKGWNPSARGVYHVTLSFINQEPIYFCDWWASTDGTHSPTGIKFYTAPNDVLLYSTPSTTTSLRNVKYTAPFTSSPNVSSIYIEIYKSTNFQIYFYYLSCYTCMIASPSATASSSFSSSSSPTSSASASASFFIETSNSNMNYTNSSLLSDGSESASTPLVLGAVGVGIAAATALFLVYKQLTGGKVPKNPDGTVNMEEVKKEMVDKAKSSKAGQFITGEAKKASAFMNYVKGVVNSLPLPASIKNLVNDPVKALPKDKLQQLRELQAELGIPVDSDVYDEKTIDTNIAVAGAAAAAVPVVAATRVVRSVKPVQSVQSVQPPAQPPRIMRSIQPTNQVVLKPRAMPVATKVVYSKPTASTVTVDSGVIQNNTPIYNANIEHVSEEMVEDIDIDNAEGAEVAEGAETTETTTVPVAVTTASAVPAATATPALSVEYMKQHMELLQTYINSQNKQ